MTGGNVLIKYSLTIGGRGEYNSIKVPVSVTLMFMALGVILHT